MKTKTMSAVLVTAMLIAGGVPSTTVRAQEGGPKEGIKVHGHWAVDVRNADGGLASHTEFENALVGGNLILAQALTQSVTLGSWSISVAGVGNPCAAELPRHFCVITDVASTNERGGPTKSWAPTLQATPNVQTGTVTLTGWIQAPAAGSITIVQTYLNSCGAQTPISDCHAGTIANSFTGTTASPGIAVIADQIIQFTVTISFS